MKLLCLSMLVVVSQWALASDDALDVNVELNSARAMIESADYEQALKSLDQLAELDSSNADVWNLHGYAHRKQGNLEISAESYQKALTYNPDHKGALEYQGELFVMLEDLDGAKANLAKLQALCPDGCEELTDLEEALEGL